NKAHPNPDDFIGRASELGAQFNGTTSEERVNYYLTVPADSVEGGMKFLAAALINPLFRKDELEREREVVIGEDDRNESSPFFKFSTEMGKALWTTAWSRKNPLGERGIIQSTTPEKMRTIQQRYYVPNNTAIIITGDISAARSDAPTNTSIILRGDVAAGKACARAKMFLGNGNRGEDPPTPAPTPP